MSFDDTLSTTADIVRREVLDPRVVAALAARGFTDTYDIEDDPTGVGPILDITATGPTKAGVMATQAAVTADVQNQLQELQTDLPAKDQVVSMVATSSPKATLMVSKKARPVVAVLVVGFILILAIPQVVDAVQKRGRDRRKKGSRRPWARIETPASAFSIRPWVQVQPAHPNRRSADGNEWPDGNEWQGGAAVREPRRGNIQRG